MQVGVQICQISLQCTDLGPNSPRQGWAQAACTPQQSSSDVNIKPSSHKQDPQFTKVIQHLHPDIRIGKTPPSFFSDVYCYAQLLTQMYRAFVILMKDSSAEVNQFWENVNNLASLCLKSNSSDIPYGRDLTLLVHKYLLPQDICKMLKCTVLYFVTIMTY